MKTKIEDPIVSKAILIIKQLDLNFYISHLDCFKDDFKDKVQINEVKRQIIKMAKNQGEMNYLFVDKIIKQIKLLLV